MKKYLLIALCLGFCHISFAESKTPIRVVKVEKKAELKKVNKISIIEDAYVVKDSKNNVTLVLKANF